MITSFPRPRFCFGKRILRLELLLSKGSYRVMVWEGHHNPKTVPELPEFSLWCELMWQLHCRSHDSNRSCLFLSLLVWPCSASYIKYQGQRNKTAGLFSNDVVSQYGRIYLLELEYVWFYPSKSWTKGTFSTNSMSQDISKAQCFWSSGRILSGHDFWNFDFWDTKNFLRIFSPLRSVGFCVRLGLGQRLPRQHTAAFGSPRRPRLRGGAAPRGQGGHGCEQQKGPWPRTRIGGGTSWGWDHCEAVNKDVYFFVFICSFFVKNVRQKYLHQHLVAFTFSAHRFLQSTDQTRSILVWQ